MAGEKSPGREDRTHYAGLRIDDLRHTAVSFWIHEGANIKRLTTRARHSSAATLIDRYGHLFPANETGVMTNLAGTIAAAKPRPMALSRRSPSPEAFRCQILRSAG